MNNVNEGQKQMIERLQAQIADLEVRWNEEQGVASLLAGRLMPWEQVYDPKQIFPAILKKYGLLLGPPDIAKNYQVIEVKSEKRENGYRANACQLYDKLPVYGGTLLVFTDQKRGVYRIQSSFWRDVKVTAPQKLGEEELQRLLADRLHSNPDGMKFEAAWKDQKHSQWEMNHFPLAAHPTLYLYPVKEGFHPAYNALAYLPMEWQGIDGHNRHGVGLVQLILDAATGSIIIEESTKLGAYTDQTGDGLSTLQDSSGNYLSRTLHIVQKDNADFYLLNRSQSPVIRTYDAYGTESGLENKLKGDTDLSKDVDGHWKSTTTNTNANDRRDSQQPELDGHFYAEQACSYYHNLGWEGFDDGGFGTIDPVKVATHIGMDANAYFSYYVEPDQNTNTNRYRGYIAFYDGECDGNTVKFDFMAGDPVVYGHEYQHAVTFFGSRKSNGEPGRLAFSDWDRAIHEGMSDSLSCLRKGAWTSCLDFPDGAVHRPVSGSGAYQKTLPNGSTIIVYPRPFRINAYPRSTQTHSNIGYCDHFDDRKKVPAGVSTPYWRSTLVSHLAYLVGQGGIHQRASRGDAEFIPVKGVGLDRAAEIFLYALMHYFGSLTISNTENTLIDAALNLLDAAKDVPGSSNRSPEYVMMRRALYALGLYPFDSSHNKVTYGGEACMIPWTIDWQYSQPYLGFPALWWQSPDLFINNNGSAEYNAVPGQENNVFARVRNIGDKDLQNLQVKFYFSPMGTNLPAAIAGWHMCKDQAGTDCVLNIPTLAANGINFTDVNNPPGNQAVHWYLDPGYVMPQVEHFCLRAVIECKAANHDNDCPNEVQSNIQYKKQTEGAAIDIEFQVANWLEKAEALDLRFLHTFPRGYRLVYVGEIPLKRIILQPREPQTVKFKLLPPRQKNASLAPPYDGRVTAKLEGGVSGNFTGQLNRTRSASELTFERSLKRNVGLTGLLAGNIKTADGMVSISGDFYGELDPATCEINGMVKGNVATAAGRYLDNLELRCKGCLEPLRAVHFTQFVNGEPVGGITVHVELPRLRRQRIVQK